MKNVERPRRLRQHHAIREMIQDVRLHPAQMVWPVFIQDGKQKRVPITSMPGVFRWSVDQLLKEIDPLVALGLRSVALFPQIEEALKDAKAKEAINPDGLVPRAVQEIKKALPHLLVITDVALDPYSSEGHDGLVRAGEVLNDETVVVLAEQALMHAEAGADFVAPSDMMDGRVGWIRQKLDENQWTKTGIIAYSAKYASCFYGPFREALNSAPRSGDKKSYQMNPWTKREAAREARLDQSEGADVLLVKPGLAYLDVVQTLVRRTDLPVAVYNVSGEYAMVKAAAEKGWLDEHSAVMEIMAGFRRAGAQMIFSYHTPQVLNWLKQP